MGFEWRAEQSGENTLFVQIEERQSFTFAGLYEHKELPEGGELHLYDLDL